MKTFVAVIMTLMFVLPSGPAFPASLEETFKKVEREKAGPPAAPKAAEQGNAHLKTVRTAAEQGDARAQYVLGVAAEAGDGMDASSQSPKEAAVWYRKRRIKAMPMRSLSLAFCIILDPRVTFPKVGA